MGFKIILNGETVWESDGSERLINEISVDTPRGQAALIRVPPEEKELYLTVNYRTLVNQPLDLVDAVRRDHGSAMVQDLEEKFGGPKAEEGNPLVDPNDPANDPYAPSDEQIEAGEKAIAEEENGGSTSTTSSFTSTAEGADSPEEEPAF